MRKTGFSLMVLSLFFVACNNSNSSYKKAEDAEEAGTFFIRAALDGEYDKAQHYMLRDTVNTLMFDKWKSTHYEKLTAEDKIKFKNANIHPIKIENVNDSTVNYIYTNSYKNKDTTSITIVKVNGEWLIDLKSIH